MLGKRPRNSRLDVLGKTHNSGEFISSYLGIFLFRSPREDIEDQTYPRSASALHRRPLNKIIPTFESQTGLRVSGEEFDGLSWQWRSITWLSLISRLMPSVIATAVFENGKDTSAGCPESCSKASESLRSPPTANSVAKQFDLTSAMFIGLTI